MLILASLRRTILGSCPSPLINPTLAQQIVSNRGSSIRSLVSSNPFPSGIHAIALLLGNRYLSIDGIALGPNLSKAKTSASAQNANRPARKATLRGSSVRLAFRSGLSGECMDWSKNLLTVLRSDWKQIVKIQPVVASRFYLPMRPFDEQLECLATIIAIPRGHWPKKYYGR